MSEKFLEDWSVKLNVPLETLTKEFEIAKKEMMSHFPDQKPEMIFEKARLKLKVDHKRTFMSNAISFVGIVIGSEAPRDKFQKMRNELLEKYLKAKEQSEKTGDQTIVQQVLERKHVRIGENKEIIPIWPKNKRDGNPSKVAGHDMPSQEESLMQNIFMIGTPLGKKEAKGIILELNGKACNQEMYKGKIVNFKALDKTESADTCYKLTSNQTSFIPGEDVYLQEGLSKIGITGMIQKFFSDNVATWEMVNGWVNNKTADPKKEFIPENYRNLLILPNSACVHQNFNPDTKNRVKINICSASDDFDDKTILCLADKSIDKSIDFAENSKIIAIGRPWLPEPKDVGGEANLILFASGMFAYPEFKIPRIDAQPLSEKELMQSIPKPQPSPETGSYVSEGGKPISVGIINPKPQQDFSGIHGAESKPEQKPIPQPKAQDPW